MKSTLVTVLTAQLIDQLSCDEPWWFHSDDTTWAQLLSRTIGSTLNSAAASGTGMAQNVVWDRPRQQRPIMTIDIDLAERIVSLLLDGNKSYQTFCEHLSGLLSPRAEAEYARMKSELAIDDWFAERPPKTKTIFKNTRILE